LQEQQEQQEQEHDYPGFQVEHCEELHDKGSQHSPVQQQEEAACSARQMGYIAAASGPGAHQQRQQHS
jgi:hypothetical protein